MLVIILAAGISRLCFSFLDPPKVIKKEIISLQTILREFPNLLENIDSQSIDNEYRELKIFDFKDLLVENEILTPEQFWKTVLSVKHVDGSLVFQNLSKFISALLVLPVSSANVERTFSMINSNKTKNRNRLNTETLKGILLAKDYLRRNGFSCRNLEPQKDLLKKINVAMYT